MDFVRQGERRLSGERAVQGHHRYCFTGRSAGAAARAPLRRTEYNYCFFGHPPGILPTPKKLNIILCMGVVTERQAPVLSLRLPVRWNGPENKDISRFLKRPVSPYPTIVWPK